jgi:sulfate permease, SulP family
VLKSVSLPLESCSMDSRWIPASVRALRTYSVATLVHDVTAGVVVGLVALPLAMAFAIASGLTPQAGIYCAIVTGFLISALGGSRTQIGGPTGAFVVVVAGIVSEHGVSGLYMCTMMAGVMLVVLGATGMGTAVKFLPRPVVVGFTNGIAVLIASTQIKDFFGLAVADVPAEFGARMAALAAHATTMSVPAVSLALTALGIILVLRQFYPKIPGTVLALAGGTIAVAVFGLDVETIGSRFGGIPAGLPTPFIPKFEFALVPVLFRPALTVAMLGAIESLMSAIVADRMSGDRHNPNTELLAQGVANIASPIFGGLPATGAIARTATNIRSGARTPVAGMVHALVLLIILVAAAPLAAFIPLPVLAAILFVVAYNMGEWHEIPKLLRLTKTDIAVWWVTFVLTVFADLTLAVEVGMILAALLFIRRVASTTTVSRVTPDYIESGRAHSLQDRLIPPYVTIFRIHGPLLFGMTDKITRMTDEIHALPPIVIVRLRNMTAIDATGIHALEDLADLLRASGRTLLLCGAREQPLSVMHAADLPARIGESNLCANIEAALVRAAEIHRAAVA